MKSRKLPKTYIDNASNRLSDRRAVGTARRTADGGSLIVNGINDFVGDLTGARVVLAATESGSDAVQRGAEAV